MEPFSYQNVYRYWDFENFCPHIQQINGLTTLLGNETLGPEEDGISISLLYLLWKGPKDVQPEPFWGIKETMLALRATLPHDESYFSLTSDLWRRYRLQGEHVKQT